MRLLRPWPPVLTRAAHHGLTAIRIASDVLPARLRYGHVRELTTRVLGGATLAAVPGDADQQGGSGVTVEAPGGSGISTPPGSAGPDSAVRDTVRCTIVTGSLDVGGVEAVIGLLALQLPRHGVDVSVVALHGGRTAQRLQAQGVKVLELGSARALAGAVAALRPDVLQVHNAPAPLVLALLATNVTLMPVAHNVEVFRREGEWALHRRMAGRAPLTLAVSDAVRRHHSQHAGTASPVRVIPNGVPDVTSPVRRDVARARVSRSLRRPLAEDDVLVVSLARCTAQKNLPGLVDAFLAAAARRPRLRLLVAGDVEDWLDWRLADTARWAHQHGDRVDLLRDSDARVLLAAADGFVLASFIEGWPMSATEAVAAGVPLVMTDVGGARELVGDGSRGRLVPPACAPPVTARSLRAARRARHQRNRDELVAALVECADRYRPSLDREGHAAGPAAGRTSPPTSVPSLQDMVRGHAHALNEVTVRRHEARP